CAGIISVTLPDSVKSIAGFAFNSCPQLTGVVIPAGVKEIGNRAFDRCPRLTLFVAEGSYGEKYAQENGIRYEYIAE
ncbi:MAG: leucine-rich repeat domain-containing protein, partial [Clostridia bacterium]|nr:leucine-rich repeat domain-containing protein [Clostridia bacterium]